MKQAYFQNSNMQNKQSDLQGPDLVDLLKAEFSRRIEQNPRYSLRAFAGYLQMNPGELSAVMNGKRGLSKKAIPKVIKVLDLTLQEQKSLLQKQILKQSKLSQYEMIESSSPAVEVLSEEKFRLISNWFAIHFLAALDLKDREWSAPWFAKRFGISQAQAKWAMTALEKTGLVAVAANGKATPQYANLKTFSDVPSVAIRKFHQEILKLASQAIDEQRMDERHTSGLGIAISKRKLPKMKQELDQFLDQLMEKYKSKEGDEVYFIETVLFKLTK